MGVFEDLQSENATTLFEGIGIGYVDQTGAGDSIKLGGHAIPGEIDISDIKRSLARQHKRGSGDDGAEVHFRGLKPCDFTITTKLHTEAQWVAWKKIRPTLIDYNTPQNRNQVSVTYELLAEAGIQQCVVHEVSTKRGKGGDPITVTISCSSVKVKPASSHKPGKTTAVLGVVTGAGTPVPYRPGLGPLNRYNSLPLNARSASALEQARIDNGVPISIATDDFDRQQGANTKLDEQIQSAQEALGFK